MSNFSHFAEKKSEVTIPFESQKKLDHDECFKSSCTEKRCTNYYAATLKVVAYQKIVNPDSVWDMSGN